MEIMHFNSPEERLDFVRGKFEEISLKEVKKEPVKAEKKVEKPKKAPKKGKKEVDDGRVQAE